MGEAEGGGGQARRTCEACRTCEARRGPEAEAGVERCWPGRDQQGGHASLGESQGCQSRRRCRHFGRDPSAEGRQEG